MLLDDSIGIVSLGGRAGTGKSALALCAGLEAVMERRKHRKVVVFRPLYAVGGQELGYLPGTEAEKMSPWAQAVFDTLGSVVHENVMEEVSARGLLEVLPLTHIRGRSLHDAFVIVDEAQSLERGVLLTVLSRIGQGSRVVLTHDVAQRDNLRVGRHDGIVAVIEALKGHPLFAHITLTRSERSPIAAMVTDLLDDLPELGAIRPILPIFILWAGSQYAGPQRANARLVRSGWASSVGASQSPIAGGTFAGGPGLPLLTVIRPIRCYVPGERKAWWFGPVVTNSHEQAKTACRPGAPSATATTKVPDDPRPRSPAAPPTPRPLPARTGCNRSPPAPAPPRLRAAPPPRLNVAPAPIPGAGRRRPTR